MSHLNTRLVHVGSEPHPGTGALVPPISLSTTFAQKDIGVLNGVEDINSFGEGYDYSRGGNPTRGAFERAIASAENGKHGLAFACGLGATSALMNILKNGDHIICVDDVYGGTQRLFRKIGTPAMNFEYTFTDMSDPNHVKAQMKDNTKMMWVESPTNPTLKVTDIRAMAALCKERGVILVVDNTFMSPFFQSPLDLGADVVMHSVTKYIGGHSDVLMGAIACNDTAIYQRIKFVQMAMGAVPSPFECYNALRGLKTLHIRMERCAENAQKIAELLEASPQVNKVHYMGLPSHPQYEIAKGQTRGSGGMITFFIKGGLEAARAFLKAVKVFTLAESLGAVESLVECPALMTHASVPAEARKQLGIDDSLIRCSVGIEHGDDLVEDVRQALAAAAKA